MYSLRASLKRSYSVMKPLPQAEPRPCFSSSITFVDLLLYAVAAILLPEDLVQIQIL